MTIEFRDVEGGLGGALRGVIASIDGETVTLRELLPRMGEHGLLMLCALLTLPFLIPVSVPGVSTVFGAAIILISLAIVANRLPWLPARVLDRRLDAGRLRGALEKGLGVVARVERWVRPRLPGLTRPGLMARANGLALAAGGALLMAPLGLIPFSNTLPGVAVLLIALGMSQRDGAMVVAGYGMLVATVVYFGVIFGAAVAAGAALTGG